MMPPTIATLRQLEPYGTAAEALAAAAERDLTPVLARGAAGGRRDRAELAGTRRVHQAVDVARRQSAPDGCTAGTGARA